MAAHVVNLLNSSLQRSLRISPVTKRIFFLSQSQFKVFQFRFKSNDVIDEKVFECYEKYGVSREDAGVVFSKLRSSKSMKVEIIQKRVDFLIKECDGNEALFNVLLRNHFVHMHSPDRVKKTLDVLRQDLGCDSDEIVDVLKRVPSILQHNPSDLRSRIENLPEMFDSSLEYICPLISRNPTVLWLRKNQIKLLISWMKEMNFSMDEIRQLLLVKKGYIYMSADKEKSKVELLKAEFHLSDSELKQLIVLQGFRLPYVSYELSKENIKILREETQISNDVFKEIILKSLRTISNQSFREKINYIRTDMGFTNEQIIKTIVHWYYSLPRLKSRHKFLLLHNKNVLSLSTMLYPSDKIFVEKYFPGVPLQDFQQFKKKYY